MQKYATESEPECNPNNAKRVEALEDEELQSDNEISEPRENNKHEFKRKLGNPKDDKILNVNVFREYLAVGSRTRNRCRASTYGH